jgi:uncharacterized membrane protein
MDSAGQEPDGGLVGRLDDLELRITFLESVVLEGSNDKAPARPSDADVVDVGATARPLGLAQAWGPDRPSEQVTDSIEPASSDVAAAPASAELIPARDDGAEPGWSPDGAFGHPWDLGERAPAEPHFGLASLEERVAGRALALVGGAALILGAVFFLSLAFSRGWIGPDMQVALGLAGGSVAVLLGGFLLLRGDRIVGHVLTAVGLATISVAFFAAISIYALLSPVVGLAGTLVAAGVVTAIAIAGRAQVVAGFGLAAVLAAPPILGADADLLTLAYLAIVLAGVTIVSLWQTWSWLPVTAFVLSAPQVCAWIWSQPPVPMAFIVLLAYWALMAAAAGGGSFRLARPELSLSATPLFMISGVFACAMAFELMPRVDQQVAFLLALAALHAALAAFFLVRRGPVDPFGLLSACYGLALASMAVPLAFGASLTAVVWSAEAATLAVIAGRRSHGPSLLACLVFCALAGLRIVLASFEPGWTATHGPAGGLAISLAFYLVAALVICLAVPSRAVRLGVVGMACLACLPVIFQELDGPVAVAAWTGLAVVALTAPRWLSVLPERALEWRMGPALEWLLALRPTAADAALLTTGAAALAGLLAVQASVFVTLAQDERPGIPFSDAAGICALLLVAGCLLAARFHGSADGRPYGIIAAGVIIAIAGLFQAPLVWAVVLWALLSGVALWLGRSDPGGSVSYLGAAAAGLAAVAVGALLFAPLPRLVVSWGGVPSHPFLLSEATLAVGVLAAGLALGARLYPRAAWSTGALAAAGAACLYLISIGVVDVFAGEAFGPPQASWARVDELAKQAHVALSVTWTAVGVLVTAAGLLLRRAQLRVAGLAVLALASAKVFVFDLASLDVAYRVVTLIVLGILLIAIALAWTRLKPASESAARDDGEAATAHGLAATPARPPRKGSTPVR